MQNWLQANFLVRDHIGKNANWLIDFVASYHITLYLKNLSIHSDYGRTEDIVVGDANGIPIFYIGSIILDSITSTFKLDNVLCALLIK